RAALLEPALFERDGHTPRQRQVTLASLRFGATIMNKAEFELPDVVQMHIAPGEFCRWPRLDSSVNQESDKIPLILVHAGEIDFLLFWRHHAPKTLFLEVRELG